MEQHIVQKSITIAAQPGAVWDALTNPQKTKQYFFNCEVHSNWKHGGEIMFKGKMFLVFNITLQGKILEIIPGQLLKYSLGNKSDNGSTTSMVTIQLRKSDRKTVVDVTDDVDSGDGADKRYKRSMKGWDKILSGLKNLVEENQ